MVITNLVLFIIPRAMQGCAGSNSKRFAAGVLYKPVFIMYVSAEFSPDTVKETVEVVTDSKLLPCTERTFENSMSKSPEIIMIDPDDSVTDNSDEAGSHFIVIHI
ncbi:MAG: hypothetical protein N0E48_19190 [Candidatus Thiodiazotropha endolucinida]|nr:hypothetical protein [Candidatus Thiodiazotropha taylori]MCW4345462.1 hypothetical protein [Candidatus Thiodiazotropha endolucinida]